MAPVVSVRLLYPPLRLSAEYSHWCPLDIPPPRPPLLVSAGLYPPARDVYLASYISCTPPTEGCPAQGIGLGVSLGWQRVGNLIAGRHLPSRREPASKQAGPKQRPPQAPPCAEGGCGAPRPNATRRLVGAQPLTPTVSTQHVTQDAHTSSFRRRRKGGWVNATPPQAMLPPVTRIRT